MEFERYEDVIDAFERDNMGYETLTDYINGNNIKIAEIDMEPMADLKKALGAKEGGLMVAIQKFNQGGPIRKNYLIGGNVSKNTPNTPYDSRASVADFARAIDRVGAGTDLQKAMDIDRYGRNIQNKNIMDKFVNQPSFLGPATQQAAKNLNQGVLASQSALDILNKTMTPFEPTLDSDRISEIVEQQRAAGVPETGLITNFKPTMADVSGPSTTTANTIGTTKTDPFYNQLQLSGAVTLDEALDYAKRRGDPQVYSDFLRREYDRNQQTPIDYLVREEKYKDASKPDITDELTRIYNLASPEYRDFDTLDEYVSDYYTKYPYYAAGGQVGMAGDKTYHQVHDQYVPMDEESMDYAYGGGVGSMMQPKRQNYANGGVYRGGGADYIGLNPNAPIEVEDLTVPSRVGDFRVSASKPLNDQSGMIEESVGIMSPGVNTIEGALIPGDKRMDFADARRAMTQPGFTDQATVYDPYGIKVEDGRFSYDMNKTSVDDFKPSWQGYVDLIQNPENNPNALNWQRTLNNIDNEAFNEIKGINFIDAPIEDWRNKQNHPMKGPLDAWNYRALRAGTPEATAKWMEKQGMELPENLKGIDTRNFLQKSKDKLGNFFSGAKEGITSLGGKFKEGAGMVFSPLTALASMRNPLNPNAKNYNPNLAGQLNSLWENNYGTVTSGNNKYKDKDGNFGTQSGSMLVQTDTGLKYGSGSVLSGQNAISGFGTNDYVGQLDKYISKMKKRAQKKSLSEFQNKKLNDALQERKIAIEKQAADSRKRSAEQYNPAQHGGTNYGLGSDGQQSYSGDSIGAPGLGFGVGATTGGPVSNRTGRGRTDWADGGIISLKR